MGQRSDDLGTARGRRSDDAGDGETVYGARETLLEVDPAADMGRKRSVTDADSVTETDVEVGVASGAPTDADDGLAETRAQIGQTRAEMSETIAAIQDRLKPENLVQQAKDTVREATVGKVGTALNTAGERVQDAMGGGTGMESEQRPSAGGLGQTVLTTIKENPLPAALAGIGVSWLVLRWREDAGSRMVRGMARSGRAHDSVSSIYPYGGDTADAGDQGLTDRVGQAGSTLSDMTSQAGSSVAGAAGQVREAARNVAMGAGDTGQSGSGTFQRLLQETPLAVGLLAAGLGPAAGLASPRTPQEDHLMGEARDTLLSQAQQTAQQVQTVAQDAVGSAVETAKHEMQDQHLIPGTGQ